jgi:hypothetical protein
MRWLAVLFTWSIFTGCAPRTAVLRQPLALSDTGDCRVAEQTVDFSALSAFADLQGKLSHYSIKDLSLRVTAGEGKFAGDVRVEGSEKSEVLATFRDLSFAPGARLELDLEREGVRAFERAAGPAPHRVKLVTRVCPRSDARVELELTLFGSLVYL